MKFILCNQFNNDYKPTVVDKVDGVFLQYVISQFFAAGGGWNSYFVQVKKDIQGYFDKGKEVIISIQWGSKCGNYVWDNCRYIELYEKVREGADPNTPKHYNKYPVIFDTPYLDLVQSFLEHLKGILGNDMSGKIMLQVGGINQNTFELRVPNQDFQFTDNPTEAYTYGANKWTALGYTNDKMRAAMQRLLNDHNTIFPDTIKIVSPIAGTTGFPKLNNDNTVNLNPPNLATDLISYMKWFPNFAVMPTALYDTGGTPSNMVNQGLKTFFQLNYLKLNKSTTEYEFEHAILNAQAHGGTLIECYEISIQEHNDIIQRYR